MTTLPPYVGNVNIYPKDAPVRRPYHHGNLRSALIEEALQVLSESGPTGLSLRELARRIGVSHAAPYRHFADKEALLAAISQDGFEALAAALAEAAATVGGDPLEQFTETGWAYVRFALEHPQHYRAMFGSGLAGRDSYPALLAAGQRAFDVLVQVIEAGQRQGRVIPGSSRELATVAWTHVHGLAMLLIDGQLRVPAGDAERMMRFGSGILRHGLATLPG